ncbi:hypothetical protein BC940DRAFT_315156 [Gongronella butleri]|nr:hypothetical protein BC940DRAFT_315156 [Gongronella butleri]
MDENAVHPTTPDSVHSSPVLHQPRTKDVKLSPGLGSPSERRALQSLANVPRLSSPTSPTSPKHELQKPTVVKPPKRQQTPQRQQTERTPEQPKNQQQEHQKQEKPSKAAIATEPSRPRTLDAKLAKAREENTQLQVLLASKRAVTKQMNSLVENFAKLDVTRAKIDNTLNDIIEHGELMLELANEKEMEAKKQEEIDHLMNAIPMMQFEIAMLDRPSSPSS